MTPQQQRHQVAQQLGSQELTEAMWYFIENHAQWGSELTNDAFFTLRGRLRAEREDKSEELASACPTCGSVELDIGAPEQSSYDPEYVSQSVACTECETEWKNMFKFSGSEEY